MLIVDDVQETLDAVHRLLSFAPDIDVVGVARNGTTAIELVKRLLPNVVLMDIFMPEMDGLTATELILRAAPQTSVIVMSVANDGDTLRRAAAAGAWDYVAKPFSNEELLSRIRSVPRVATTANDEAASAFGESRSSTQSESSVTDLMAALRASVERAKNEETTVPALPITRPEATGDSQRIVVEAAQPLVQTMDGDNFLPRRRLIVAGLFGVAMFVAVMFRWIEAYGAAPGGLFSGRGAYLISLSAHALTGSLSIWLQIAGLLALLGLPFSLIGVVRRRIRWYVIALWLLALVGAEVGVRVLFGIQSWLGGSGSLLEGASLWGASVLTGTAMLLTVPEYVVGLWSVNNGGSLGKGRFWLFIPLVAFYVTFGFASSIGLSWAFISLFMSIVGFR